MAGAQTSPVDTLLKVGTMALVATVALAWELALALAALVGELMCSQAMVLKA
jgi:hypothetical protein